MKKAEDMNKAKDKVIIGSAKVGIIVALVYVVAVLTTVTVGAAANPIDVCDAIYITEDAPTEGKTPVTTLSPISTTMLQNAIERAQAHLIEEQNEEGYWVGKIYHSSRATSLYILLTEYMGIVNKTKEDKMVKVEEIFLPYMYHEEMGKTIFELLEERDFNLDLLEPHNENKKRKIIDIE